MYRAFVISLLAALIAGSSLAVLVWTGADAIVVGIAGLLSLIGAIVAMRIRREGETRLLTPALDALDRKLEAAASARLSMRHRAELAGRFREEFVAAVRHELNTPLNSILGFSDVLLTEIDGPLSPQQLEDVQAIRSAGGYLSELIEAVLEEWAPDGRTPPLPLAPVDVPSLATEVAALLRGQTAQRQVQLLVRVESGVEKPLGDRRRLRQVLINLGTNAVRATERGSVTFEVAPLPDAVRVTVRDTGHGIAPEDLPNLFREFVQGGNERRRAGGSGLGLSLTRALVEWHGGRIEIDTCVGEGSAFHVILPLRAT